MKIQDWSKYGVDATQDFDKAVADLIGSHPNAIDRCDVEQFAVDWLVGLLTRWQKDNLISIWSRCGETQEIDGFDNAYREHRARMTRKEACSG